MLGGVLRARASSDAVIQRPAALASSTRPGIWVSCIMAETASRLTVVVLTCFIVI